MWVSGQSLTAQQNVTHITKEKVMHPHTCDNFSINMSGEKKQHKHPTVHYSYNLQLFACLKTRQP